MKNFLDLGCGLGRHSILFALNDFMSDCSFEKKQAYLKKILESKSNNEARGELIDALAAEDETIRVQLSNKKFTTLFHEMGHLQDYFQTRVSAAGKFSSEADYPKALKEWLNDEEKQGIAYSISTYATTGPGEFIAETYAKLLSGDEVSADAINLYKKMNGPKIPNISNL